MNFKTFAEKLIKANKEAERRKILENVAEENFLKLAQALRDTYYQSWTNEPERVWKAAQALKSLVKVKPTEEIKALSLWVSGIAYLTKGNLDSAIKNLDKSAEIFQSINQEHESAQTQVAKLYPLALLGRYDEAVKCGKRALEIFLRFDDELEAGKIENNIGNIYFRRELHREAEIYYLSALKRFQELGEISFLAMTENGLASNYSLLNDFRNAEKFYEKALLHSQQAELFVRQAEIEVNIGKLALFRGKFDRALLFLEKSRQKYDELRMPHQVAVAELEVADIYSELNLNQEAFEIYGRVTKSFAELKMQGEEARSRANFGRTAIFLGDFDISRAELGKAAKLYESEQNPVGTAIVKLSEAQLEFTEKNYKSALKLAVEAENLLDKSANYRYKLTANWLKAECFINLGKLKAARELLEELYDEATRQENGQMAQVSQISLGKAASIENNPKQAEKHYKKAIELIETLRAPLSAEEFRMAFLADKLLPFENLAKIYLAENKLQEAFLLIEKARARTLAENLEGNFVWQNEETSTKLTQKLKDLREELNWFYSRLSRAEAGKTEDLQSGIKQREKRIADVMRQIESTKSACAEVGAKRANLSEAQELKDLQKTLGSEKVLIEFVCFDGNFSAFVITSKKIHFVENLARETLIIEFLEGLRFQFGTLRYGAKNLGDFVGELKKRADFYLEKLYEKLLLPLEKYIGVQDLVIVPVGALHYVPFHALRFQNSLRERVSQPSHTKQPAHADCSDSSYLIENREIVYVPSAKIWQFLMQKPAKQIKNALLIGFADEKIPLVNREIEAIEKIFPKAQVFTDGAANFENYTKNAPAFDVLHLACHGQFRTDNSLFSSLHLADGFVTVKDICSQKLKAELVTLSACETGLNKIFAGDEILGLARGFLLAGVSTLILSLWTVNDEATTELMKDFYTNLQRGFSISASLQTAQNNFIKRGAHPYFWSPFALIGR